MPNVSRRSGIVRILQVIRLLELTRRPHELRALATRFDVSERTMRRDLKTIEAVGGLVGWRLTETGRCCIAGVAWRGDVVALKAAVH